MSEEEVLSEKEEWKRQITVASKGNAFKFGSNRELRRLPGHLNRGEQVISIVTGSRKDKRGRGIVVATNMRLFFLWSGYVFRENNDLPYTSLNSIEFKTGIFFGELIAFSAGDEVSYNWVGRFSGRKFVKAVRQLSTELRQNYGANAWGQAQSGRQPVPSHQDQYQQPSYPQEQSYDRQTRQTPMEAPRPVIVPPFQSAKPPQFTPQQSLPPRPAPINSHQVAVPPQPLAAPASVSTPAFDPAQERFQIITNQIRELGVLKEAGLITSEEYETKRKLLVEQL